MKAKQVLFITLKIIGIIAFWKAIQSFGGVISGIGIFSSLFANKGFMNSSFMLSIGVTMIFNFIVPLMVAILFLFRTENVVAIIKIDKLDNIDLNLSKLVLYHIIIIVFGFILIMDGAGNFLEINYNTDTKTVYTTNNQSPKATKQEKVFVTNSESKNINYVAFIEIILGIVLLAKATDIAKKIERKFDLKSDELTKETSG